MVDIGKWRWVFYINLPVGGVSFAILFFSLHLNVTRDPSWTSRLRRLDFIGNGIIIAGCTAILVALTYAGTLHPWGSWQTLVPLLLGFAAFVVLFIFEASRWAPREPVMSRRLFAGRTSVIVCVNTFLNTALIYGGIFFWPVYFQSVQLATPRRAGVCLIPLMLFGIPAAAVGAAILAHVGRYKILHLVGFATYAVGRGLLILLDETTPTGEWVAYELLEGVGGGLLLNTLLPAFQAPLEEAYQAAATATWNFFRTMGGVWGIAVPAAVFAKPRRRARERSSSVRPDRSTPYGRWRCVPVCICRFHAAICASSAAAGSCRILPSHPACLDC